MGSYRRRKETCGDIDVFITRPKDDGLTHAGILPRLLKALHAAGILTEDLSLPEDSEALEGCYRGLCVLPGGKGVRRRIGTWCIPGCDVGCSPAFVQTFSPFHGRAEVPH